MHSFIFHEYTVYVQVTSVSRHELTGPYKTRGRGVETQKFNLSGSALAITVALNLSLYMYMYMFMTHAIFIYSINNKQGLN